MEIANVFASVVKYDTIKHFAAFGSILYVFAPKNGEKYALFKNGLTACYLWRISCYHINRFSPIVSRINEPLLKTARANSKWSWKHQKKPQGGGGSGVASIPLVRPKVKELFYHFECYSEKLITFLSWKTRCETDYGSKIHFISPLGVLFAFSV